MNNNIITITCPKCGKEFLPGEIYLPKHFLGQPETILRNNQGQIEDYDGIPMDLNEEFICDKCNSHFKVTAKVSFKTIDLPKYDMSNNYRTSLFEEKLTLDEDNLIVE